MTKADKPVVRETYSSVRQGGKTRPLVVEIHPTFITVRPKGTRKSYAVTMDQLFTLGARNAAEQIRRDRLQARKERKAGR